MTLTDPWWAAYNGARARPRGAVVVRIALTDALMEKRSAYHALVAGGCRSGDIRLACLCCRSDCRECGETGLYRQSAARGDRQECIPYGGREHLPAVPWGGWYRWYAGWCG